MHRRQPQGLGAAVPADLVSVFVEQLDDLARWQLAARAGQHQVLGDAAQVLPIQIGRLLPAERFHPMRQRRRRAQRTAASDQYGTSPPNTCVS